jgi:hypothetical protein
MIFKTFKSDFHRVNQSFKNHSVPPLQHSHFQAQGVLDTTLCDVVCQ